MGGWRCGRSSGSTRRHLHLDSCGGAGVRTLGLMTVWAALFFVVVGVVAGTTGSRLVQYGIVGAALGLTAGLIAVHAFLQGALRPARAALAGDTAIGDSLPRSRPSFGAWLELSVLGCVFAFSGGTAAMLGVALDRAGGGPIALCCDRGRVDACLGRAGHRRRHRLAVPASHSRPRGSNCTGRGWRLPSTPAGGCRRRRSRCVGGLV